MGLALNKILGSILNEFEKAASAADLSREYLRESYQSHPVLKDTIPSKIRVAEASISMPLAFEVIGKEKTIPQEISKRQIRNCILSDKETIADKEATAGLILAALKKKKQSLLSNKNLAGHIAAAGRILVSDFELSQTNLENIEELQRAFKEIPTREQESKFIFQTEELEKIQADRIFRLDFKLVVD